VSRLHVPLEDVARPRSRRLPALGAVRESSVQAAVLRYLRLDRRVAWVRRFNTGAHVTQETTPNGKPKRRLIRYAFPGCSDLLGQLRDGRLLAVEVKTRNGRVSPAQQVFLATVERNGGVAVLARSIEDVGRALDRAWDADAGRRLGASHIPAEERQP